MPDLSFLLCNNEISKISDNSQAWSNKKETILLWTKVIKHDFHEIVLVQSAILGTF